jgi:hypothetical protein
MLLTGKHRELFEAIKRVFEYLNLDQDVIPSNAVIISNLKKRYDVCEYVWENVEMFLTCLARDCSRSYHSLGSDNLSEYLEAESRTVAVLYDSQCQMQQQFNLA